MSDPIIIPGTDGTCFAMYIGHSADNKEAVLQTVANRLPQTINMPCGQTVEFKTIDDIPRENTICPCGDPNHFVVFYNEVS